MLQDFRSTFLIQGSWSSMVRANYLKGGIVYADEITTVSPTYADEICTT